jgi:exocyst complex component 3
MSPTWIALFSTGVLLATLSDYMGDVQTAVEPSFVKRVAEAAFEELARKAVNIFIAGACVGVGGWVCTVCAR